MSGGHSLQWRFAVLWVLSAFRFLPGRSDGLDSVSGKVTHKGTQPRGPS